MSEQTMTPYAAAKLVNAWIADKGVDKKVPPQMLYTYVGKGYIEAVVGEDGKKRTTETALRTWFDEKYAPKNLGQVKVDDEDPNQLALELEA